MKYVILVFLLSVLFLVPACQSINNIEFYEPTPENAIYCTPSTDKTPGYGPVKSVQGKFGSPDFSDNKSFIFRLSFF